MYLVMVEPPSLVGTDHATTPAAFRGLATTLRGAPGGTAFTFCTRTGEVLDRKEGDGRYAYRPRNTAVMLWVPPRSIEVENVAVLVREATVAARGRGVPNAVAPS
jgi:hypothetical protein